MHHSTSVLIRLCRATPDLWPQDDQRFSETEAAGILSAKVLDGFEFDPAKTPRVNARGRNPALRNADLLGAALAAAQEGDRNGAQFLACLTAAMDPQDIHVAVRGGLAATRLLNHPALEWLLELGDSAQARARSARENYRVSLSQPLADAVEAYEQAWNRDFATPLPSLSEFDQGEAGSAEPVAQLLDWAYGQSDQTDVSRATYEQRFLRASRFHELVDITFNLAHRIVTTDSAPDVAHLQGAAQAHVQDISERFQRLERGLADQALERGQAVVAATAHLGNISLVWKTVKIAYDEQIWRIGANSGTNPRAMADKTAFTGMINTSGRSMIALRDFYRSLKSAPHIITGAPDGPRGKEFVMCPVLGAPVRIGTGMAKIAYKIGASTVYARNLWEGDTMITRLYPGPDAAAFKGDRTSFVQAWADGYAAFLGDAVRAGPETLCLHGGMWQSVKKHLARETAGQMQGS